MTESNGIRPESLSTRVRRGVALLDEKVPGWHNKIDVDTLHMSSPRCCVLGQVYGSYNRGFDSLQLELGSPFGFDLRWAESVDEYATLDRLWRFVVRSRQAATFFAHPDVQGNGFDLVYAIAPNGDVWCWSEKYGWHESKFGNLNEDSDFDRAHFADHLDRITVEQLPVGAR